MAAQSVVLACSSTPQAVAGSLTLPPNGAHGYIRVRLKMISGTGYLGDSGVTTAGYPLTTADAAIQETLLSGETLYVASSSGATASLGVLRLGETT